MRFLKSRQKGFSLVELLVYIAISGIVITGVISYFSSVLKIYGLARSCLLIANNKTLLFEKLHYDLRYADDIDDDNSTFNSANGVLQIIKDGDVYVYSIDDCRIIKSVNTGSGIAISSNDVCVESFWLSKIDTAQEKEGINISVTLSSKSSGASFVSEDFNSDIFVRERVVPY